MSAVVRLRVSRADNAVSLAVLCEMPASALVKSDRFPRRGTAIAAALSGRAGTGKIVAVVSGGNIDLARFSELVNAHAVR